MAISNIDKELFDWWGLEYLSEYKENTLSLNKRSYREACDRCIYGEFVLNSDVVISELLTALYGDL